MFFASGGAFFVTVLMWLVGVGRAGW